MELYFWPGQKNHPRDTTVGALTNHLLRHYAIIGIGSSMERVLVLPEDCSVAGVHNCSCFKAAHRHVLAMGGAGIVGIAKGG